jgi:hypothetical protein
MLLPGVFPEALKGRNMLYVSLLRPFRASDTLFDHYEGLHPSLTYFAPSGLFAQPQYESSQELQPPAKNMVKIVYKKRSALELGFIHIQPLRGWEPILMLPRVLTRGYSY